MENKFPAAGDCASDLSAELRGCRRRLPAEERWARAGRRGSRTQASGRPGRGGGEEARAHCLGCPSPRPWARPQPPHRAPASPAGGGVSCASGPMRPPGSRDRTAGVGPRGVCAGSCAGPGSGSPPAPPLLRVPAREQRRKCAGLLSGWKPRGVWRPLPGPEQPVTSFRKNAQHPRQAQG